MALTWLKINPLIRQLTFFSIIALMSSACFAGIYKWTDAEGKVHYGQHRPRDTSSETLDVQQHAPQDTSSYKRPGQKDDNAKTAEADKAKKTDEPEEAKETKAEKKQRLADCKKLRDNLITMESSGRVRSKDKDGNTKYLSQAEKEQRMTTSRKKLSKHCN